MGAIMMSKFENLPLGFRFRPSDVELIDHYLRNKINGNNQLVTCISQVNICNFEPWDLPDLSAIRSNDHEWFFFCPRDKKNLNGQRTNRATDKGFWKATGKDRTIRLGKTRTLGMKKTLVFYTGRAPGGKRTNWVIHEYRTTLPELDGTHPGQEAFVLCRLFEKPDEQRHDGNACANTDEVETHTCAPTEMSPENISSGQAVVGPSCVVQGIVDQSNCIAKTPGSMISETGLPDHSCHSNSYNHPLGESKVHEAMTPGVDSHLSNAVKDVDSSNPHFLKFDMRMDEELHGVEHMTGTAMDDEYFLLSLDSLLDFDEAKAIMDDFDLPNIELDDDLCDENVSQGTPFVGSNPSKKANGASLIKESVKETKSCCGSDVEVADQVKNEMSYNSWGNQLPVLTTESGLDENYIFSEDALEQFCDLPDVEKYTSYGHIAIPEDGNDGVGTGIKISPQPRHMPTQPSDLQMSLEGPDNKSEEIMTMMDMALKTSDDICIPSFCPYKSFSTDKIIGEMAGGEERDQESKVDDEEVVETGIKIRTRRRRSQRSSTSRHEAQGDAQRRIRLQMKTSQEDEAKPRGFEQELCRKVGGKIHVDNKIGVYMMKVVVAVLLFIVLIGLLKAAPHIACVGAEKY